MCLLICISSELWVCVCRILLHTHSLSPYYQPLSVSDSLSASDVYQADVTLDIYRQTRQSSTDEYRCLMVLRLSIWINEGHLLWKENRLDSNLLSLHRVQLANRESNPCHQGWSLIWALYELKYYCSQKNTYIKFDFCYWFMLVDEMFIYGTHCTEKHAVGVVFLHFAIKLCVLVRSLMCLFHLSYGGVL